MDRASRNASQQQQDQWTRNISGQNAAMANEYFEQFVNASSLKHILGYYRGLIDNLHLRPTVFTQFYPKLRANLTSWRAKALWKKFDARASHKCYSKGRAAPNTRVLIIGAGPCGLRSAIEAQLLGAKVVLVEKRDRFSRNNVLHLWPFVIEDLRMLGAKKFFGKFCAGAIDHISIRQLQCILLKVALLLGVEVHTEVGFERLIEPQPDEKIGWRAELDPPDHPVSQYEFDVIIGADGKRNTLQGFTRKEFRGKLAIAITANFINKKTEAEARVEEISGVAFIFNQKFFKELHETTRIDLENIVYYKDDTHYFVMTAKKASLLEKGVIKQDLADTEKLLAPDNVDRDALENYAIEAANFSTNYQLPDLEFAVNHYAQPDIAMFDFTSMYAAENASKVLERNGHKLLMILVGDSLLEPFWPTGSGCARGFLSSLDAAWAIRGWGSSSRTSLDVIAERESVYRLLAQTTPDNLNKDWKSYTLDPSTRYPNLNKVAVTPRQVACLYDTDDAASLERMLKRNAVEKTPSESASKKRRRGNVDNEVLLTWLSKQLKSHEDIQLTNFASIFKDGNILCAIIHHYRPDLLDYNTVKSEEPAVKNQLAFDILEKELGIPPVMTGQESINTEDYLTIATYLTEIYDTFRGEIPHVKHPKLDLPENTKSSAKLSDLNAKTFKTAYIHPITSGQVARPSSRHKRHAVMEPPPKQNSIDRKARKRKTLERVGASVEERQKILEEIASNRTERQNKRRQQRRFQTAQFIKSMQMLQSNAKPDSQPFEDYAIFLYRQTAPKFEDRVKDLEKQFTYVPHHDNKGATQTGRATGTDDDLVARIKSLEDKWRDPQPVEKKPKDLLRAIGKIETSDWNIKEIEKKIMENKMGKPSKAIDKEKVPKWSKEQFLARQTKMERQHYNRQESGEAKYADIDKCIQKLDQKLKEGTTRELGTRRVASIRDNLVSKVPAEKEAKRPEKSPSRTQMMLPSQSASEFCHFCNKRVYLMERLSAEGRFFHHGCFKCQYCHTQLRLGSYAFDRDGIYGYKFFCVHHFGMEGELPKVTRKPSLRLNVQATKSPPDKGTLPGIANVDLLDRVQTPERIEFSNLSTGNASSIHEDSLSQMDEDEWTDRNFGASCAEQGDSDDETSSDSDSDIDDEEEEDDAYDDALEDPEAKDGAAKWPDRWKHSYRRNSNDSDEFSSSDGSSYYENSSDDDESDTATEGEDEIRARELRRQEVQVEPPVVHTDTGTDTEIVSDESSSESSSEVQNSATEISTDSEFAQDDPTPTREMLTIALNDFHVTKTRGSGNNGVPRKIQVTSGYIQRPGDGRGVPKRSDVELKLKPLVSPSAGVKRTLPLQSYALNRTQSTGGMAAKVSLELKKKYLLGDAGNSIQKSGSATALDSKFKSFQSNITDCQKLLKPAPEVSNSMQTFCNIIAERKSPTYMTQHSSPSGIFPTLADSKQAKDGENEEKKMLSQNPPSNVTETETKVNNEETEPLKKVIVENPETNDEPKNENVPEGRPRSPLHETSIIVPQIDWGKKNDVSSDSLNSSSDEDKDKVKIFGEIPTVTVDQAHEEPADLEETPFDSLCHVTIRKKVTANEEIKDNELVKDENVAGEKEKAKEKDDAEEELLDSLCIKTGQDSKPVYAEAVNKNVSSEKKSLNQPKTLPNLSCALPDIHKSLHLRRAKKDENSGELETEVVQKNSSGISSPESMLDQPTALTDTELSDWARDGIVSDDLEFEDIVVDPKDNQARNTQRGDRRKSKDEKSKHIADISEIDLDKNQHKKDDNFEKNYKNTEVNEAVNAPLCEKTISEAINKSILGSNSDIAFMDTGMTESSSDADTDKNYSQGQDQGGYRLLKNDAESDFAEDSLNPCVNIEVFETRNENVWSRGKDDSTKIEETPKNTGYCYLTDENEDLRENVSEATKSEVSKGLDDQNLLTVETGTTTEENTCSDSTVKPVTELNFDKENLPPVDIDKTPVAEIIDSITKDFNAANIIDNKELSNVRLTKEFDVKDKDTKKVTNADSGKSLATKSDKRKSRKDESVEFDERHQGLKSNVDFKNAKDSIDIRKARRRSKPDVMAGQPLQVQQKPDLIQEGSLPIIDSAAAKKKESMVLNLTPDILYRKNVIQKERDVNQRLVHEMVMNKMKTLERKRRSRERPSPVNTGNENMSLWRSKTATDLFAHRRSNLNESKAGASTEGICDSKSPTNVKTEAACSTPDVLLSTNILPRLQNSKSAMDVKSSMSFLDKEINEYNNALKSFENDDKRPVSVFSSFLRENEPKSMASMPEISDAPKAPPRYNKSDDISRKLEKLKQNVKVREKKRDSEERSLQRHSWIDGSSEKDPHGSKSSVRKSKSKEGEDKKVHRRNSWLYSANMDSKAKSKKDIKGAAASIEKMRRGSSESVLKVKRSKSFSEICDKEGSPSNIGKYTLVEIDADAVRKSDPNILELETDKKTVEGEKQSGGKKKKDRERRKSITKMFATLFTRKSPTGASKKGGLFAKLSPKSKEVSKEMEEKPIRQKSLSETSIQRNLVTPPPIPPLPKNYHAVRMTDDSSDGELECRRLSSCDTLDHSGAFETSAHGSRSSNKAMKAARQSQAKRLRLAQEIQRKLQETEVKTKELEIKGVEVEKALRGECGSECDCAGKDETELLREWFALMRDRQELRRYERELTDRAKELELEDRYQRLGRDMRDKLSIEHDGQAEVGI